MAVWTIKRNAEEPQTFASLRISGLRRTQVSQAMGTVSFTRHSAYDAAPLFAVDDLVTIYKDGVVWHVGPVLTIPREGGPRSESQIYTIGDPWWFVDNMIFPQPITIYNDDGSGLSVGLSTKVTMFAGVEDELTVYMSVEQMINRAMTILVAAGADMQVVFAGDFSLRPPVGELSDPTCAEVIRAALQWVPDAGTGWDYSTTPPTLRISRRGSAPARTLDAGDGRSIHSVSLTPRDDLRRDRVLINYEVTNTVDGKPRMSYHQDAAGEGSPFRTIRATMSLSGYTKQYQEQKLVTEAVSPNSTAWWKANLASLANATGLSVEDGDIAPRDEGGPSFSFRVKEGNIPAFLEDESGPLSGMMRVTARGTYSLANGGASTDYKGDALSTDVHCTNLESATYRELVSETAAEPVPVGIAAMMHAALSVTHYDGAVVVKARECVFLARTGDVLNVTNGVAAWATMAAQIQQVDEEVDAGETTITVGPPHHLGPQDLLEMLRAYRTHAPSVKLQERATGTRGDGQQAQGPLGSANDNGSSSGAHWKKVVAEGDEEGRTLTLDADAGLKAEADGGKLIELDVTEPRQEINDGDGKRVEITPDKITMEDAEGHVMELTAQGLTFTKDGKTSFLSWEGLVVAGDASTARIFADHVQVEADGNSVIVNDEQVLITTGDQTGVYEAAQAYVSSSGGAEASMSAADGLAHTDGSATIEASAGDGLAHESGGDSATLSAPAGLGLIASGDTTTLTASEMQMSNGSDTVTINAEAGFHNVSSSQTAQIGGAGGVELSVGGGTTHVRAVEGETIEMQETEVCEDGETKEAWFLRGEAS
ncbi:MAG: hypothetical protein ACO1TE_29090 [Prosthecobacter sp.]